MASTFSFSYAWADARDYAVELAERLEREVDGKSYSCFLDSDDYSKGDDWKEMGKDALKKTSILILVGSPRALKSEPVLREVQLYTERKNRIGKQCYPVADSILLLFDGGGSNSASKNIFTHDLQAVANSIGMPLRVAHYPSYRSKYNPIERRFFPHLSRACTGLLFDTLQTVMELMRGASTSTGLTTTVNVIRRLYETGRNATDEMKAYIRSTINFHDVLPKWNYTITPQLGQ